MNLPHTPQNIVFTVSKLTADIKNLLERNFPFVWVTGEISNLSKPGSGHHYFTLKDEEAQISAVMFRGQNRNLKFSPADGMSITGLGRISVYPPRGTYQIIFEYIEPKGIGELQVAFEQLKTRLSEEGLFDERHKQKLPFLPRRISLITSPTGSVVYDIIKITQRRFPNIQLQILPIKVQGPGAESEIVSALALLNQRNESELAILARGGGSLEDLNAFNSEAVARAIFASKIPIISAVGHETDFTISDFVADLRAPTPSAAAEIAVPLKYEIQALCQNLKHQIILSFNTIFRDKKANLLNLGKRLLDPRRQMEQYRLRVDDLTLRFTRLTKRAMARRLEQVCWWADRLRRNDPQLQVQKLNERIYYLNYRLLNYIKLYSDKLSTKIAGLTSRLQALSPTAVLDRGYSITRSIPDRAVIRSSDAVFVGQELDILLARGSLVCRVGRKSTDGQEKL